MLLAGEKPRISILLPEHSIILNAAEGVNVLFLSCTFRTSCPSFESSIPGLCQYSPTPALDICMFLCLAAVQKLLENTTHFYVMKKSKWFSHSFVILNSS